MLGGARWGGVRWAVAHFVSVLVMEFVRYCAPVSPEVRYAVGCVFGQAVTGD